MSIEMSIEMSNLNSNPYGKTAALASVLFWGMVLILYIMNFQNLFQYEVTSKEFILSAIGTVITPLGCCLGLLY